MLIKNFDYWLFQGNVRNYVYGDFSAHSCFFVWFYQVQFHNFFFLYCTTICRLIYHHIIGKTLYLYVPSESSENDL